MYGTETSLGPEDPFVFCSPVNSGNPKRVALSVYNIREILIDSVGLTRWLLFIPTSLTTTTTTMMTTTTTTCTLLLLVWTLLESRGRWTKEGFCVRALQEYNTHSHTVNYTLDYSPFLRCRSTLKKNRPLFFRSIC